MMVSGGRGRPGPPAPGGELAGRPRIADLQRPFERAAGVVIDGPRMALEPCDLGPCGRDGRGVLQFTGPLRQPARLVARARVRRGEVVVPSSCVPLEPRLFGELNAPLELLPALRRSYQQLHRAAVAEHVDKDLPVVETLRNLHRARAPG